MHFNVPIRKKNKIKKKKNSQSSNGGFSITKSGYRNSSVKSLLMSQATYEIYVQILHCGWLDESPCLAGSLCLGSPLHCNWGVFWVWYLINIREKPSEPKWRELSLLIHLSVKKNISIHLIYKMSKIVKNICHSFPDPNEISLNSLFCLTTSPKTQRCSIYSDIEQSKAASQSSNFRSCN